MRFILNFIFFGILFYLLWDNFPEQFEILKSWAASAVDLIKSLYNQLMEKLHVASNPPPPPPPPAG
ncbi:MAG: hypothetical protein H0U49_00925 [Parachlamydiaceae bacterium]|nr:hypothetical protein [Parachlamydiaceae bacterium]